MNANADYYCYCYCHYCHCCHYRHYCHYWYNEYNLSMHATVTATVITDIITITIMLAA